MEQHTSQERTLTVRLYAVLAERAGRRELELRVPAGPVTVAAARARVGREFPELGPLDHVRGVIGTSYAPDGALIGEGDVLHLLPPVSGGAGWVDRFELCSEPLDPGAAWGRVSHPSAGAVVVFSGHTREQNRGQRVERLVYEALEAMAGPEMGRIFAEARERFGPPSAPPGTDPGALELRMWAAHRTGVVDVGEPSVIVAVASPHRKAAFEACRFLIDTLKERLPVWKRECYPDGSAWIHDRS